MSPRDNPVDSAAVLYHGKVMHARLKPRAHRFVYRVMYLLVDLDRLSEAGRLSTFLAINAPGVFSFHERDHGTGAFASLRSWADGILHRNGIARPARIMLLSYPRMFGYVFNPLSVYYCYGDDDALSAVIYEVRNTFGEIHHYVREVAPGELTPAGLRQTARKTFYVSPFIAMDMRYHFHMSPPGEAVKIRILETDAEGPLLAAVFSGRRRPVSTPVLLAAVIALPLMTLKVIGAIHFEALRLWFKGNRLVPRVTGGSEHGSI